MKIPVIRGRIGDWIYYSGLMSFEQISLHVKPSIGEIYEATCLEELLQRELTKNYQSIKQYLLNDRERFFNAIILAIYDGDPQWLEVEFPENEREYTNVGFLQFSGAETIFPVDGQHRVKGIMEAIKERPELNSEQVPVIFIAHSQTPDGRKRTRKLFSTLNRRNKPVGQNENIALDEDDICSIITRELIQSFPLFEKNNVANTKTKSIPPSNKKSFTSLITLYQVVDGMVRWKYTKETGKSRTAYKSFLLYRPDDQTTTAYLGYVTDAMKAFTESTSVIKEYLSMHSDNSAERFRNGSGGNILFRPIVLTEYFAVMLNYSETHQCSFAESFQRLDKIEHCLNKSPWLGFLWDGKKIINRTARTKIRSVLEFLADRSMLSIDELENLYKDYAVILNIDIDEAKERLNQL